MTLRTVGVRLTAEIGDYQNKLKAAGQTTRDFKGELDKAAKKGNLDAVATQAGAVGIGLLGLAATAVKSAADFDKAMSSVSAATHAPKAEIEQLRAAALQAGKDTMYSATEAADGITELSKAGVSTADILGGGLKGALSLAAAGQLAVGDAAEIAASALTQFKLAGSQVPHVADLLAAGAGKAQGSVQDIGMALSQSGLVAAQFGLSIEDTTGALAEFASAGLIGSDAGTSLKTMLLALANPSTQTRALMSSLGISFYDATGKFIGLSGVAQVLQTRLKGLTDAQRQQALGQIFGNDAIRSASILYTDGAAGVSKWKGAVNDAGYAAATAQKQTDNLAGDIERLKGSIETLAIESGSGANGGLRILTKTLNGVVDQISSLPSAVGSAVTVLAALGGGALLGLAGWVKLRKGIADAAEQLAAMGPAGEKAAGALSKVSSVAGKASLVFAALEVVELVGEHFHSASVNVDQLTDSLANFSNTGKAAGELSDTFGANLKDFSKNAKLADMASHGFAGGLNDLTTTIPGVHTVVDSLNESLTGFSFNKAKDNMDALDQSLTSYMTTTNDARKSSDLWNQVLTESGLDTQQLAKLLPNAYKEVGALNTAADQGKQSVNGFSGSAAAATSKLGDLNSALDQGASMQNQYKTEADAVAGAARGEKAALGALYSQLKAETDPVFALIDAQQKMKDAQTAATKAVKEHGKTSAEAKSADLNLAQAALGLQNATGNLAGSFNGKLDPAFRQTLHTAGVTDAQIKVISGSFADAKKAADKYTGKYAANVSAPGAPQAKKQLDDAYTAANHFAGPYVADLKVTGLNSVQAAFRKLSSQQQALKSGNTLALHGKDFATGGWTGPGSKYQPAGMVHADEFVIQKSSRQSIESKAPGLLDSMNTTGNVPGYAGGGAVMPFPVTAAMTKIPTEAQALSKLLGSAGGGNLGAWIMAGIAAAGVPASWAGPLHTLIMRESGGNPRSINLWDSNALAGHPSQGLMQTIPSTFEAHRLHSLPDDIYNPVANIVAGIRYIEARYGSIFNVQQANANLPPKGYANGGWINEPVNGVGASGQRYTFAEHRPEYVDNKAMPNWQAGPGGGMAGGGAVSVNVTVNVPVGANPREAGKAVADVLDRYCAGGGRVRLKGSVTA